MRKKANSTKNQDIMREAAESLIQNPNTLIKRLFKDDRGKPLILADYQNEIVRRIIQRYPRKNLIWSATRAGKSLSFAIGIILLCIIHNGSKVRIIAPTADHTRIIMGYVIQHFFDSDIVASFLNVKVRGMTIERLKEELSKRRLTMRNNSEIQCKSADLMKGGRALIGIGGTDLFIEEAEHIPPDIIKNNIMRMLGDDPESTIHMISNPVKLGYMYEKSMDSNDNSWTEMKIDWKQAVNSGRLTENFINERRAEMTDDDFKMWYNAEYPENIEGVLIPRKYIEAAVREIKAVPGDSEHVLGVDVARFGVNLTVMTHVEIIADGLYIVRDIKSFSKKTTMMTVGEIKNWDLTQNFDRILVDDTGLGGGVTDRLKEFEDISSRVTPFISGESPTDGDKSRQEFLKKMFINNKVRYYTHLANLFEKGSIIIPDEPALKRQLRGMSVETSGSTGKKKIVDPEDGKSPDFADSLMIACSNIKPRRIIVDMT